MVKGGKALNSTDFAVKERKEEGNNVKNLQKAVKQDVPVGSLWDNVEQDFVIQLLLVIHTSSVSLRNP